MKKCPQCHGEMEKGFTVPYPGSYIATAFVDGERVPPNINAPYGRLKNVTKTSFVDAYKCKDCGLIQNYAKGESVTTDKFNSNNLKMIGLVGGIVIAIVLAFFYITSFID